MRTIDPANWSMLIGSISIVSLSLIFTKGAHNYIYDTIKRMHIRECECDSNIVLSKFKFNSSL